MIILKAGFARRVITPQLGPFLQGYLHKRPMEGVLDDLEVTAVAFNDGEKSAVILGVDTIDIRLDYVTEYRKIISEYCNIPFEAVFINSSHTHTGPGLTYESAATYRAFLGIQLRDAAAMALADLKPAKLSIAKGEAKGISFIRRYRMKDGGVQTNPGVDNPDVAHPLGCPNEEVNLVKVERDGGDDIFIVTYGTHADTIGGNLISRDWPGFVRDTIERSLDGVKTLFLTASQGDVNHINPFPTVADREGLEYESFDGVPRGYEHAKHMGRVVAGAVLQICGKTEPVADGKISYAEKVTSLPTHQENDRLDEARKLVELYNSGREKEIPFEKMELTTVVAEARRIIQLENGPDHFDYILGALAIGDIVFCAVPGEMFVDLGRRVEKESSYKMTLVCCLTNGGGTYFPTTKAYEEGGYEARSSRLAPGSDDIMVRDAIELFESIK